MISSSSGWHTRRLVAFELTAKHSAAILALFNDPRCLRFIGDKGLRNESDAQQYIATMGQQYRQQGFGMWAVHCRETKTFVGLAGILQRPYLTCPDVGYAMSSQHRGQGFGFEAAQGAIEYAQQKLKVQRLLALTQPDNLASIGILQRLNMVYQYQLSVPAYQIVDCAIYRSHGMIAGKD